MQRQFVSGAVCTAGDLVLSLYPTYSEQSGMGGSGLLHWYLLPTKDTLQVRPYIFVEDTVKEKYTNTLQGKARKGK